MKTILLLFAILTAATAQAADRTADEFVNAMRIENESFLRSGIPYECQQWQQQMETNKWVATYALRYLANHRDSDALARVAQAWLDCTHAEQVFLDRFRCPNDEGHTLTLSQRQAKRRGVENMTAALNKLTRELKMAGL